jgi:hypothetical protein
MNGFVELSDIDSDSLCGSLALGYNQVCERAKAEPTTKANIDEPCHLVERCFYLGTGDARIFCFVALVDRGRGLQYFGIIAAPEGGNVNNPLKPVSEWTVSQHVNATRFRTEFAKEAPGFTEECDEGDTLILRGPAQSSESNSPSAKG